MIRIDVISEDTVQVVLAIAGRLADDEVTFVEGEITRCLEQVDCLVLDLKGVKFIDRAGLALLKDGMETGLQLRNGSPFIRTLLEANGLEVH